MIVSLSQLFSVFVVFWLLLQNKSFEKSLTNKLHGLELLVMQQGTFYPHQEFEQVNFHTKSCLYKIGQFLQDEEVAIYIHLARKWKLSIKNSQNFFFKQHFQPLHDILKKKD